MNVPFASESFRGHQAACRGPVGRLLRNAAVVAVVGALALGAAGCSKKQFDSSGVESVVTAKLAKTYAPLKVGRTTCPRRVGLGAGVAFSCTAEVAGVPLPIRVTQRDAKGRVSFVTTKAVIDVAAVEADLAKTLHDAYDEPGDIMKITTTCPGERVRVLPPRASFTCDVTASAQHFVERVTITAVSGAMTYQAVS